MLLEIGHNRGQLGEGEGIFLLQLGGHLSGKNNGGKAEFYRWIPPILAKYRK